MPKLALLKHNFTKLQKAQIPPDLSKCCPQAEPLPSPELYSVCTSAEQKCSQDLQLQLFFPTYKSKLWWPLPSVLPHFVSVSPSPHAPAKMVWGLQHPLFRWPPTSGTFPNVHAGCDCRTVFLLGQPLHAHSAAFSLALMPVGSHSLGAAVSWVQWCAHCNKEQVIWWR